MNQMPGQPVSTVEDSINRAADAALRASNVLDAIWSDLTGDGADGTCAEPPSMGLVYTADVLATRINIIADRLESIRARIASPKVATLSQSMAKGQYNAGANAQNPYGTTYTG